MIFSSPDTSFLKDVSGTRLKTGKGIIKENFHSTQESFWWWDFDPVYTLCTIKSELPCFPFVPLLIEPGWISASFQWTGSTPGGFQEAFRAAEDGLF